MAAPTLRGSVAPSINVAPSSHANTAVGDLVLVWYWSQGAVVPTHTLDSGSGFVEIRSHSHDDGTTDARLSVAYKIATVSGAQTYTAYTVTNGTASQTSCGTVSIPVGEHDVASLPPSDSATLTSNAVPNPPQLTSLTGDYLVFACAGWNVTTAGATAATAMSNYTNLTQNGAASHVTHLAWASRALTALSNATEDPGAFGDNVTPNGSASLTFAIKGRSAITGTAATSATAQTSASTGIAVITGTAASSSSAQASASSGGVSIAGSAATTTGAQTSASSGTLVASGSVATACGAQTSASSGAVTVTGYAATASSAQTSEAAGSVLIAGALETSATEQVSAAEGTVEDTGVSGSGATESATQESAGVGLVAITGTCATVANAQASAMTGEVAVSGSGSTAAEPQGSDAIGVCAIDSSIATSATPQLTAVVMAGYEPATQNTTAIAIVLNRRRRQARGRR